MSEIDRPEIEILNSSGRVSVREVMRLIFYFKKPHQTMASTIREVITTWMDLVSMESFAYGFDAEGDPEEFTPELFQETMHDHFEGMFSQWPNATIEFVGEGGNAPMYKLYYCGKGLDEPDFPDDNGILELWLPRNVFTQKRTAIENYFQHVVIRTNASSAYMSYAFVGENKEGKQSLAKRYLGADIADTGSVSVDLGYKCPGVYWKTYLGPEALALAERSAALSSLSKEGIDVIGMPNGGVIFQLTKDPAIGDKNRRERLVEHEKFAAFLESKGMLHVPEKVVYFDDESALGDRQAQEEWHRRFLVGGP